MESSEESIFSNYLLSILLVLQQWPQLEKEVISIIRESRIEVSHLNLTETIKSIKPAAEGGEVVDFKNKREEYWLDLFRKAYLKFLAAEKLLKTQEFEFDIEFDTVREIKSDAKSDLRFIIEEIVENRNILPH